MDADAVEACLFAPDDERCEVRQGASDRNSESDGDPRHLTTFLISAPRLNNTKSGQLWIITTIARVNTASVFSHAWYTQQNVSCWHPSTVLALRYIRTQYRSGDGWSPTLHFLDGFIQRHLSITGRRGDLNSRPPVPQTAVAATSCCSGTRNVLQEFPKLPEVSWRLQNIAV
jgi:hypothetical protein